MPRLNTPNREAWLSAATDLMRAHFRAAGFEIPRNVKSTCGFPSRSALARKQQRIGECWSSANSDGNNFEIFISPIIAEPLEAAAILAHELIHATVGLAAKHGKDFARCAKAIGLEGKMTATTAGEAFKRFFARIEEELGDYPHAKLNASSAPKKQTTRMLKVECPECRAEGEPYIVRMTAAALERGAPICPIHGCAMVGDE